MDLNCAIFAIVAIQLQRVDMLSAFTGLLMICRYSVSRFSDDGLH
jgi:hypothetical protein